MIFHHVLGSVLITLVLNSEFQERKMNICFHKPTSMRYFNLRRSAAVVWCVIGRWKGKFLKLIFRSTSLFGYGQFSFIDLFPSKNILWMYEFLFQSVEALGKKNPENWLISHFFFHISLTSSNQYVNTKSIFRRWPFTEFPSLSSPHFLLSSGNKFHNFP